MVFSQRLTSTATGIDAELSVLKTWFVDCCCAARTRERVHGVLVLNMKQNVELMKG